MKRPRLIISGVIVLALIVGGVLWLHAVDSPVSATNVSESTSVVTAEKASNNMGKMVSVSGSYAQFSYPSLFTPLPPQSLSGNVVASYGYERRTQIPWQLNITINFLAADEVGNDSAYNAAIHNPTRYSSSSEMANGSTVTVMTDTTSDGYDKVAFLFRGSYSVDISLNSNDASDAAQQQAILNEVIQSWRWK